MSREVYDGGEVEKAQAELQQGLETAKRLVEQTRSLLTGEAPEQAA